MPFTPAHPLFILPFKILPGRYVSFTALIIGSIVPDMEYFLRLNAAAAFSHSIKGIFYFNLPVTMLLAWLWHKRVRHAVIHVPFLRQKIKNEILKKQVSWYGDSFPVFVLSALAGIASHIVLDGFTHPGGYFARQSSFLLEYVTAGPYLLRRCYLIWYLLSITGTLAALFILFSLKKAAVGNKQATRKFLIQTTVLALMISVVRTSAGLSWNTGRHLIIILIGSFIYAFIFVGMIQSVPLKEKNPQ